MAIKTTTLKTYQNALDIRSHWEGVTPEASANECDLLKFRYNGKERLGKVHADRGDAITLIMLADGNESHAIEDAVYKSFRYDMMRYTEWVTMGDVPDDEA